MSDSKLRMVLDAEMAAYGRSRRATTTHEDPIAVLWRDTQDRPGYDRLSNLIDDLVDDDRLCSHFVRAHRMPWVGPWVEITREVEAEVEQRLEDIRSARAHDSAGCGMQRP